MSYYNSIIIRSNHHNSNIFSFITWFNLEKKEKLIIDKIQNLPHITLINQTGESIKIATIREIKEKLSFSSYQPNTIQYYVFLDADLMTIPAQNALLKSIEEPPENTQIILVTKYPNKLLATIKSRCQIYNSNKKIKEKTDYFEAETLYKKIISSSPGEKITEATKFKERKDAINVCDNIIRYLHSQLSQNGSTIAISEITKNIFILLKTKQYLESNTNVLLTIENCFLELSSRTI